MALHQDLYNFKNHQETCRRPSVLAGIASSSKTRTADPLARATIKFSDDIQRLRRINDVRNSPNGAQIKRVVDLLSKTRRALTPEQINEACCVDVNANKIVFDSLRKNVIVNYDGERFSYKPKNDLKDKSELLNLVRKFEDGISVYDLKDAYSTVIEDLKALEAEGQVWVISVSDSEEDIVYPNDPEVSIKVDDDDLEALFHRIELPSDMLDIEKELEMNEMKPATNTAQRMARGHVRRMSPKSESKKRTKSRMSHRVKLTNSRLRKLFDRL